MALRSATGPWTASPAFLNTCWPIFSEPPSLSTVSGVISPPWSAAVAVMSLNVEPVG